MEAARIVSSGSDIIASNEGGCVVAPSWQAHLRRRLFGLAPDEVRFERRAFHAGPSAVRERLESIGAIVLAGYHAALETDDLSALSARLDRIDLEMRGFAFEGAAMGLYMLDLLTGWNRTRWARFVRGAGSPHAYMVHVGAGLALARFRRTMVLPRAGFDPVLDALLADGYGFHEGYFHHDRCAQGEPQPRRVTGYARRAFDQGLGRSLWFVHCAEPDRIGGAIERFADERRSDLWSGVGLACAYAGGVERASIVDLFSRSCAHAAAFAQGVAFAAEARARAGNPADPCELACRVAWDLDGSSAAAIARSTSEDLPGIPSSRAPAASPDRRATGDRAERGALPAYEVWRARIQDLHRSGGAKGQHR